MDFLKLLEGVRTPLLSEIFQVITYFGQEVIIIAVICLLYWCVNKRFAYLLGFTYFSAGLLIQTLKITFRIPRPWVLEPGFQAVESAVSGATGYSFPSGHTMGGTCLFAPIALQTKKYYVKLLCIAAFLLIGFSRLYLGVHTPKDVLTAMGLSLIISYAFYKMQHVVLDTDRHLLKITVVLILIALFAAIYSLILLSQETIDTHYAMDACKTAGAGMGFAVGYYLERRFLNFDTATKTIGGQIAKIILGLLVALFLKEGIKMLFGTSIILKMFQYFLLVLWVLVIYPYLFTKFQSKH